MSKTIDFYKEIDQIRKDSNMTTNKLCSGIMSERTYYRHLTGEPGIKYSSLQALLARLNMGICDLVIQNAIDKSDYYNDITIFVYKLYNLSMDDIKPLYNKLCKFESENLLLQKFVEINLYKYRYLTKQLPKSAYSKLLRKALSDLGNVRDSNVYKLYINMESFVMDFKARKINKVNELVMGLDFAKNPLYSIIILDNYLGVVIKNSRLPLDNLMNLYKKYRSVLRFANILRPFTKLDLYRAYIEMYSNNEILMKKYLIKYVNGIIVTDGGKYIHEEFEEIKKDFKIDYKKLLNDNFDLMFNNPDSRFRIVKELDLEHKNVDEKIK